MPMLKDGTYWSPGEAETHIRVTRSFYRVVLTTAIRDWRATHTTGMRGHYRNMARQAIAELRSADKLEAML